MVFDKLNQSVNNKKTCHQQR